MTVVRRTSVVKLEQRQWGLRARRVAGELDGVKLELEDEEKINVNSGDGDY